MTHPGALRRPLSSTHSCGFTAEQPHTHLLSSRPSASPQYIAGKFVPAVSGLTMDVLSPTTGKKFTTCARGDAADIELALDAAHAAAEKWGRTPPAERASILLRIATGIRDNLETLAYCETIDNGKPIRETINADVPLAADHFEYFAGCLRAQEGGITELDANTMAYHVSEPLGVVGQVRCCCRPSSVTPRSATR